VNHRFTSDSMAERRCRLISSGLVGNTSFHNPDAGFLASEAVAVLALPLVAYFELSFD